MAAPSRHRSSASPLALAFAALVLYASLFPFEGWRWPAGQSIADLAVLPWPPWLDVFDMWSNLLGYLPLGFLVTISLHRTGMSTLPAVVVGMLVPSLLSYAAELAQTFLPGRHPSLKDWAMNSAGAWIGACVAVGLQRWGVIDRWHATRERWFVQRSAGALALLALWPIGLLFPTPIPLGIGQVGDRLLEQAAGWLEGVPWAAGVHAMLAATPSPPAALGPLGEWMGSGLGLLVPCLVASAVMRPGWRRVAMAVGALLLASAAMTLATLLNFGPQHTLAWITPLTLPAFATALIAAALLAPVGMRVAAGLGLVALTALVAVVAQAPSDPYFAQNLQSWEQGRFVRFHGLAQWVGWLWPYATMAWLLTRLSARD